MPRWEGGGKTSLQYNFWLFTLDGLAYFFTKWTTWKPTASFAGKTELIFHQWLEARVAVVRVWYISQGKEMYNIRSYL
jgi:hypothetical protein